MIQKIDWSKIPNQKYINDKFKGLWWDPNDEYQLPKDWGTTGITKRNKFVTEPGQDLEASSSTSRPKYSGKIIVVDSMGDVFTAPLKALGYLAQLGRSRASSKSCARKLLQGLAPHVLALNSDTYEVPIQNEEAVLGLTWTGGVVELRDEEATKDVEYIVPEDGTLYWMDTWIDLRGRAPSQRGPRVPELHPRPADPGPGDDHEPLRDAERRGEEVHPAGDPRRPGGVRAGGRSSRALEGAEDTSTDPLRNEIWEEFRAKHRRLIATIRDRPPHRTRHDDR